MLQSRKGSDIDWAAALIIMLLFVSVGFYYMTYLASPPQPFEESLKTQSAGIAEKIKENVSWTVYRAPIFIDSAQNTTRATEIFFRPPEHADLNSLAILSSDGNETSSNFDNTTNTAAWISDLSSGKNKFYLVYTLGTNLSPLAYDTDIELNSTTNTLRNSKMSMVLASSGITSLIFSGHELLLAGINLGTSQTPSATSGTIAAKLSWPETGGAVTAKFYSNSSQLVINSSQALDVVLSLSSTLTTFYNGTGSEDFMGQSWSGITDIVDVYDGDTGLAVIGNDLNVTVTDLGGSREVALAGATNFEIFSHENGYAAAVTEADIFLNPLRILIGVPEKLTGVSEEGVAAFQSMDYTTLKQQLGISGVDFYVSVEK